MRVLTTRIYHVGSVKGVMLCVLGLKVCEDKALL